MIVVSVYLIRVLHRMDMDSLVVSRKVEHEFIAKKIRKQNQQQTK